MSKNDSFKVFFGVFMVKFVKKMTMIKKNEKKLVFLKNVNPLICKMSIFVKKLTNRNQYICEDDVMNHVTYTVEVEKVCKLYCGVDNRLHVSSLSAAGAKLFLWLMYTIETGHDVVQVNRKRCMAEVGIKSVNTYKKNISELVGKEILAYTDLKECYWINPIYFFKGDRVSKYSENVIKTIDKE